MFSSALNYAKSEPIRFHMPAHNGEDIQITTAMDITELSFSDNLIESNGVIKNCEQNIAKAYGTKYALMLTKVQPWVLQLPYIRQKILEISYF